MDIRSIFNHCDLIGLQICRIRWIKRKIKAITAFKVIQGHRGRYQSKARISDFLLVINSNWHPILYRLELSQLIVQISGTLRFWDPFEGHRGNVRRSSWAHWKARCGLPISVNWTFFARCYGWGATSDYRLKIGDFAPTGAGWPKISGTRVAPTNHSSSQ